MPLKALIDGKVIQSWRCSEKQWLEYVVASRNKEISVTTCCCGTRAILRKGSRIQHFAHYHLPDNCNYKEESQQHEEAKLIIAQACLQAGYEVDTEVHGSGYIADVMATKDGRKIAFEVQLTYQTLDVSKERRERFKCDNVEDIWLFKKMPAGCDGRTPRFHVLKIKDRPFKVKRWDGDVTLTEFVLTALQPDYEELEDLDFDEIILEPLFDWQPIINWLKRYWKFVLGFLLFFLFIRSAFRRR